MGLFICSFGGEDVALSISQWSDIGVSMPVVVRRRFSISIYCCRASGRGGKFLCAIIGSQTDFHIHAYEIEMLCGHSNVNVNIRFVCFFIRTLCL